MWPDWAPSLWWKKRPGWRAIPRPGRPCRSRPNAPRNSSPANNSRSCWLQPNKAASLILPLSQIKVSFQLPETVADWAGQALHGWFSDGLLSQAPRNSLTPLIGWTRLLSPKSLETLKHEIQAMGGSQIRFKSERARDWVHEYKSRFPLQQLGR